MLVYECAYAMVQLVQSLRGTSSGLTKMEKNGQCAQCALSTSITESLLDSEARHLNVVNAFLLPTHPSSDRPDMFSDRKLAQSEFSSRNIFSYSARSRASSVLILECLAFENSS